MFTRLLSEMRVRLRAVFQRGDVERELDDELLFHIEKETDKLIASGMPREEAARVARAAFGGVSRIKDDARDERGVALLDQTVQDVRYAIRGLRTRKAFAIGVIVTLGLGIGANATMFGIVDRLLFRAPATLRDQATVHRVYRHTLSDGEARIDRNFSFATYLDLARDTNTFSDIAAFQTRRLAVGDGEAAREVAVTVASAAFFRFFDATPVAGRFFGVSDDSVPAGAPVVVLGYAFWQAHFGGRNVVGETIRVDRMLCTIVGVASADFVGMSDQGVPALYVPITAYAFSMRGPRYVANYNWSWLELIVRRRSSTTTVVADAELSAAFVRSWRNAAAIDRGWGTPEAARVRGALGPVQIGRGPQAGLDAQTALWISGVAVIVLLIACANVANLLLSRAVARRREIAVRLALGAGRARLTRQLLTESLVLAVLGGMVGLAIAQWGAAGIRALYLPVDFRATVFTDVRTLVLTSVAVLTAAFATGLAPAWHARRSDLAATLKSGDRGGSHQHARVRTALLVFQVALSAVLLVGAGLFVRSLRNVSDYRLGYDADRVLLTAANPRGMQLSDAETSALAERMLSAAQSLPGVTHAALAASVPFWSNEGRRLVVPGVDSVRTLGTFIMQAGTPDYFATMGTRILRGRSFGVDDRAGTARVAVVSEGMARVLWPGRDAIGQCIKINADTMPCTTVIGVAEEMQLRRFDDPREFAYYLPAAQLDAPLDPQLLVRVDGVPAAYLQPLRQRLQREMPGAAYVNVIPLSTLVDPNMRSWRFGTMMFGVFGALALVLAAIGLYSMITYDISQRTRELGIRIALGASVTRVVRLVIGRGVAIIGVGVAVGAMLAFWSAQYLGALMFRVSPRDPGVFAVVALVLLSVGVAAAIAPAVRAARVDPNEALRGE